LRDAGECRDRRRQQGARDAAHLVLVDVARQILDRRLAVDPRQQQPRRRELRFQTMRRLHPSSANGSADISLLLEVPVVQSSRRQPQPPPPKRR